jgi:hypothetical protein
MPTKELKDLSARSQADSEILQPKTLEDIFSAPGSGVHLVKDHPDEDAPEEVVNFLQEHGLSKNSFRCMLKGVPEGAENADQNGSANASYIHEWLRSVPSLSWVARHCGPGNYILHFTWRTHPEEDDEGRSKTCTQDVPIVISEHAEEEHRKFMLEAKLKRTNDVNRKVRESRIENHLENEVMDGLSDGRGPPQNPADLAKAYITSALDTVKSLGIPIGLQQAPPKAEIPWGAILTAGVPLLLAFLEKQDKEAQRRTEEANRTMMLMLGMGKENNQQLIELYRSNSSGQGAGTAMMTEFMNMIKGAVDMKEILAPARETLADKIFSMIEGLAPTIMQVLATVATAKQAQSNPMVKLGRGLMDNSPDFQALKHDPVEMAKVVRKMDDFYGWEQTDTILEVVGWGRPPECPHDPAKRAPAGQQQEQSDLPAAGS